MNWFEKWFCASSLWRYVTRSQILPWVLEGSELGDHALELGAGPGAATQELRKRATRVTSLEYDHKFAAGLAAGNHSANGDVLRGDAAVLPFPDGTFSACVAILVLHHLQSSEWQDRAFAEIRRVLQPGGVFLAFEIPDGWFNRLTHRKSTFVPLAPSSAAARLTAAGFSRVDVNFRRGAFRIKAQRA